MFCHFWRGIKAKEEAWQDVYDLFYDLIWSSADAAAYLAEIKAL
jgi:hypothetical protein